MTMDLNWAKQRLESWYNGEDVDISPEVIDCAYKAICDCLENKDYKESLKRSILEHFDNPYCARDNIGKEMYKNEILKLIENI